MKKVMKKILLMLTVAMLFVVALSFSASAETEGYYTYTVVNNHAIIKSVSPQISGYATVPATLGGYPVTAIDKSAFSLCNNIWKINVGNNVTTIYDFAFSFTSVLEVNIGKNVTRIVGDDVFSCSDNLSSINVDKENAVYSSDSNGVLFNKDKTALLKYPMGNSSSEYIVPDTVTSIENYAFSNVQKLKSVTIPDGVRSIGYCAFYLNPSLKSVIISDSVTSISNSAFELCAYIDDVYYTGTQQQWNEISIGSNNSCLTNATIHYNYCIHTDTDSDKFCDSCDEYLETLYKSGKCGENVSYKWYTDGMVIISGTGAMSDYSPDSSLFYKSDIKSVVIKSGVTTVGKNVFRACNSLKSVTLPDGVTSVGDSAFSHCTSLEGVTLPDSVVSVGRDAFYWCLRLKNITIGEGVTTIGDYAFCSCESLQDVIIPEKVASIGRDVFSYCNGLENITVDKDNEYYLNDAYGVLFNKDKTELIRYPAANARKEYTVPDSVTVIGNRAFNHCNNLEKITVDKDNEYYSNDEYGVLFNKDKTELIRYPGGNVQTEYTIPDGVIFVCDLALNDCDALENIIFSDSVITIGKNTISSCSKLKSVIIPKSVTVIDDSAFFMCGNLTDVYYTGTQQQWNEISIGILNEDIIEATIHYNYCPHTDKAEYPLQKPTCTEIGYTAGEYCNDCEKWLSGHEEIPALDHDWDKGVINPVSTCKTHGVKTYTCQNDTIHKKTEHIELDFSNHEGGTYVMDDTEPTCDADGYTGDSYCLGCNARLKKGEIIPKKHIDEDVDNYCDICDEYAVKLIETGKCGDGVTYRWYEDGTIIIGGTGDMWNYINGKTSPFKSNISTKRVLKVIIEKGVTSVGFATFSYCSNLRNVILGDDIRTIGEYVFSNCSNLNNIYYVGTQEQWKAIKIQNYNDELDDATICFNYCLSSKSVEHKNKVLNEQQNSTCTEIGYTAGEYCPDCEKWLSGREEIPALDHSFTKQLAEEKYFKSAATYSAPAEYYYACERCSLKGDESYTFGEALKLGQPETVTATQTTDSINLKWSAVPDATGYRVFVRENNKWVQIKKSTTATGYVVTGLTAGTKYTYAVRAYIIVDDTVIWAPTFTTFVAATQPALISKVTSAKQTATTVTLSWDKVTCGGYRVFRYNTETKKWDIVVRSTKSTTATITDLTENTNYIFAVRPYVNTGTEIIWAKTYTRVDTSTMLPAITLKALSSAKNRATIAWGKAAGATGYQVWYSTSPSSGYKKVANYTNNSTYQYNLTSGTTYYYRARAYKAVGGSYVYGAWSDVVSVTIK